MLIRNLPQRAKKPFHSGGDAGIRLMGNIMSNETVQGSRVNGMLNSVWDKAGMVLVYMILFTAFSIFVENFLSIDNMISLGLAVSTIGIVACTMLFCLASGDFDLSIGSVLATSGVIAALVMNTTDSVSLGILAGLAGGALVGFINGFLVAKVKINALIATLATMQIVRGIGYILTDGKSVPILPEPFFALGNSSLLGVPTPIWITAGLFVLFGFLLSRTTYGRNTLAIGGNQEAARLAGIAVDRVKLVIFTLQGSIAAFAGIILASRMNIGDPKMGMGFELQVISACVLGGVSLSGGIGSMLFVITGVLIMGTVENAMNLMNISSFYQWVIRGAILLGAVLFDRFKQTK